MLVKRDHTRDVYLYAYFMYDAADDTSNSMDYIHANGCNLGFIPKR